MISGLKSRPATPRRLSKRGPSPYTLDVMTRARLHRRGLMAGALGLTALGVLSACGRRPAQTDESGRVRLRVAAGGPAGGFGAVIPPWLGNKSHAVTLPLGVCIDCEPPK